MKGRKGFTLIELILVIAILGILAVSALPKFYDLSDEAKQASRDGVVGAVRAGVALWKAENIIKNQTDAYPTAAELWGTGESFAANTACSATACFGGVLANPVEDDNWSTGATEGIYLYDGGTDTDPDTAKATLTYTAATGAFSITH
ncbi:type II secretion system GspH family protein [bacterium]|nr:type II secretion system GspH family protein [bacterium]